MKKFFINLFRGHPSCTGLLFLLILRNFAAVEKDWIPVFFLYVCMMFAYMVYMYPKVEPEKREKITWIIVAVTVAVLSIIAIFFMA